MVRGSVLGESYTGSFQAFYANQNAVITSLKNQEGEEVASLYGFTPPKNTLYQGGYVACSENDHFTGITLTDGNVVVITTGSYSVLP